MRFALLAFALILSGCGKGEEPDSLNVNDPALANRIEDLAVLDADEAKASPKEPPFPLQAISVAEIRRELEPSAGCDISVGDTLLLAATRGDAIAKLNGRIVHLGHEGGPSETGGYFKGEGVSISVGRKSVEGVRADELASWPAEVAVRKAGENAPRTIAATWRCGA